MESLAFLGLPSGELALLKESDAQSQFFLTAPKSVISFTHKEVVNVNTLTTLGNSLADLDLGLTGLEPLLGVLMVVVGVTTAILIADEVSNSEPIRIPARRPNQVRQ